MERATYTTKSFIIALALVRKHLSVEQASLAAQVEVASQIQRWGEVEDSEYFSDTRTAVHTYDSQRMTWISTTCEDNLAAPHVYCALRKRPTWNSIFQGSGARVHRVSLISTLDTKYTDSEGHLSLAISARTDCIVRNEQERIF